MGVIRVLFLADTHLGYDLPIRPRIERRRRGPEFFANFKRALQPALDGRVDCVVHGGDLLFRSKVPARLVDKAFEPLRQVADRGVPVYLVPGNHERSSIPHSHLAQHAHIHIFEKPRTFRLQNANCSLALAGIPFVRQAVRQKFSDLIERTGYRTVDADVYLLCIHQAADGATVGPAGYKFRYASDVIDPTRIPGQFCAVLSGHIHRFQVLTRDLKGRLLRVPVFYAGSTERTSFAEKAEGKGYLILEFERGLWNGAAIKQWQFHQLAVRPMTQFSLHAANMNNTQIISWLETRLGLLPQDSIVKIKIQDTVSQHAMQVLSASALRALAAPTMNIEAEFVQARRRRGSKIQYSHQRAEDAHHGRSEYLY